jgi:hypothetical protein
MVMSPALVLTVITFCDRELRWTPSDTLPMLEDASTRYAADPGSTIVTLPTVSVTFTLRGTRVNVSVMSPAVERTVTSDAVTSDAVMLPTPVVSAALPASPLALRSPAPADRVTSLASPPFTVRSPAPADSDTAVAGGTVSVEDSEHRPAGTRQSNDTPVPLTAMSGRTRL